jgi:hypothetical protein
LIESCKGNPCCGENFINKLKKNRTVHSGPSWPRKIEKTINKKRKGRLAIMLHKALEGQLCRKLGSCN